MCGIVGYVGPRQALDVLLDGLRRLEYRGYDSSGVVVLNGKGLEVERAPGNLELFRRHALDPAASTRGEQALFIGLALLIVGIVWLVVTALGAFFGWLGSTRI